MLRRNVFAAHWVLGTCLLMALLSFFLLRWNIRKDAKRSFSAAVLQIQAQIDFRLERYEDALVQTRAHFQNADRVTRTQFRNYVANLAVSDRFPGIQGIGYAMRLQPSEL